MSVNLAPIFFDEPSSAKDTKQRATLGVRCLSQLHTMYLSFIEDLNSPAIADEERKVYLKGLSTLSNMMFTVNMDAKIRTLTEAEKALLEVCATRLPYESVLEAEDVDSIKASIEELRKSINELPNDSVLRTILLELARLSDDSINRFHIHGAEGLKKAFKSMLAELAEIHMQDDIDVSEVRDNTAWKKGVELVRKFDVIASRAMKYKPVLERAASYFLE